MTKKATSKIKQPIACDQKETCARCGNEYLLIWLKEAETYNDFGDRYCPFCGLMTEAFCFRASA